MTKKKAEPAAEWVAVDLLVPWEKNPRFNDLPAEQVAQSIIRFGFGQPFVARRENRMVIAGHTRLKACQLLPSLWERANPEEREKWSGDAIGIANEGSAVDRIRAMYPDMYERIIKIFPEMRLQERYWSEMDRSADLGAYLFKPDSIELRPGLEACRAYIEENIADPSKRKLADAALKEHTAKNRNDPAAYPSIELLKLLVQGTYHRKPLGLDGKGRAASERAIARLVARRKAELEQA